MYIPKPLQPGDTVAVLATSGVCDPAKLAAGVRVLQEMGLRVQVMESCNASRCRFALNWTEDEQKRAALGAFFATDEAHVQSKRPYLAGPDALRLSDLHTAFANKQIKGIFVARGGYGAARLLPHLDYAMIRKNPKVFVGFSDVTALHIVLNQFCKMTTFHGPMPASCFGGGEIHPLTLASFKDALFQSTFFNLGVESANLKTLHPGTATGILTGGNLSVIASTLGTPYEIETRGRILFLEEIGEAPYRVDRLLLQLKLAGKLSDAAGLVFGDFSPETLTSLSTAILELVIPQKKPTIWGLPCGHSSPNITLPLGRMVTIRAKQAVPLHLSSS